MIDFEKVPLADACVTEWRGALPGYSHGFKQCHSLMLVLLNGGMQSGKLRISPRRCHSLMLVLLNGGNNHHRPHLGLHRATR